MEDTRRILAAPDRLAKSGQRLDADDLARAIGSIPHRQRRKGGVDLLVIAALLGGHLAQQGVLVTTSGGRRQYTVTDNAVDGVAVEGEIGLGAQSFLDH